MRRHAFNLAALASAVLLVAVVALWWRSYGVEDTWVRDAVGSANYTLANSSCGSFRLSYAGVSPSPGIPSSTRNYHTATRPSKDFPEPVALGPNGSRVKLPGFIYLMSRDPVKVQGQTLIYDRRVLVLRDWLLASLLAVLPSWWLRSRVGARLRAARAAREGAVPCPGCGYDLRATPRDAQGTRCPECGATAR